MCLDTLLVRHFLIEVVPLEPMQVLDVPNIRTEKPFPTWLCVIVTPQKRQEQLDIPDCQQLGRLDERLPNAPTDVLFNAFAATFAFRLSMNSTHPSVYLTCEKGMHTCT